VRASGARSAAFRAGLLGAGIAAVAILANSGGNVYKMTLSDGVISRYIAAHMNADPDDVHPVVTKRGTSLRYGRIGLSAVIWLFSAGRAAAMPYVQPVIMVLCAGAVSAAVALLFERAPPMFHLAPFAAIGYLLSVVGGFQDALAIALSAWAVVAALRERWWWAAGLLAAALLTRENAGAVLVGLVVWGASRRRWRAVLILASSLLPVAAWYLYVRSRYGYFPLLDPYLRVKTSTIRPPFVAVWEALTRAAPDGVVLVVIHLVLACLAAYLFVRHRTALATIAAAAALQVMMAGAFAYRFIGEAARACAPLQLFVLLAFLELAHRRMTSAQT
jgi:hypothetical protein